MNWFSARLSFALLLILPWLLVPSGAGKPQQEGQARVTRQLEPVYPAWAYTHGVSQGYAKFAFYVDENGETSEFLPIEYSHEAFSEALLETLVKWKFEPANEEGVPVRSVCHAYWQFLPDRAVETNAMFDISTRIANAGSDAEGSLRFREERELDGRPNMVVFPGLFQVEGSSRLLEREKSVRARVRFFVGTDGSVRLPHILDASVPDLVDDLEAAFKNAVFETPAYEGQATLALLERVYDVPVVWVDREPARSL